eukprot:g35907.t1
MPDLFARDAVGSQPFVRYGPLYHGYEARKNDDDLSSKGSWAGSLKAQAAGAGVAAQSISPQELLHEQYGSPRGASQPSPADSVASSKEATPSPQEAQHTLHSAHHGQDWQAKAARERGRWQSHGWGQRLALGREEQQRQQQQQQQRDHSAAAIASESSDDEQHDEDELASLPLRVLQHLRHADRALSTPTGPPASSHMQAWTPYYGQAGQAQTSSASTQSSSGFASAALASSTQPPAFPAFSALPSSTQQPSGVASATISSSWTSQAAQQSFPDLSDSDESQQDMGIGKMASPRALLQTPPKAIGHSAHGSPGIPPPPDQQQQLEQTPPKLITHSAHGSPSIPPPPDQQQQLEQTPPKPITHSSHGSPSIPPPPDHHHQQQQQQEEEQKGEELPHTQHALRLGQATGFAAQDDAAWRRRPHHTSIRHSLEAVVSALSVADQSLALREAAAGRPLYPTQPQHHPVDDTVGPDVVRDGENGIASAQHGSLHAAADTRATAANRPSRRPEKRQRAARVVPKAYTPLEQQLTRGWLHGMDHPLGVDRQRHTRVAPARTVSDLYPTAAGEGADSVSEHSDHSDRTGSASQHAQTQHEHRHTVDHGEPGQSWPRPHLPPDIVLPPGARANWAGQSTSYSPPARVSLANVGREQLASRGVLEQDAAEQRAFESLRSMLQRPDSEVVARAKRWLVYFFALLVVAGCLVLPYGISFSVTGFHSWSCIQCFKRFASWFCSILVRIFRQMILIDVNDIVIIKFF